MKTKESLLIKNAIFRLYDKLKKLDTSSLEISAYNKRYLQDYKNNFFFFMPLYEQLLQKSINKLSKPISESSFTDYGGGCGILSFLAVELGFKTVIYNDIYEVSTKDVKVITEEINTSINFFITGDVHQLVNFVKQHHIHIDILCSFDVLEHIYDLTDWFSKVKELQKPFSICFMTSANHRNPIVNNRLKKIHYKAEYIGSKKENGWKERDANKPFLDLRKEIISKHFKDLSSDQILTLAKNTRGLYGDAIISSCQRQINTGNFAQEISHPTNTCDPLTGNWAEHIINLKDLRKMIENKNTQVKFTSSFYSYSKNKILNLPKYILSFLMIISGKQNLFLSPSFTLEITYK